MIVTCVARTESIQHRTCIHGPSVYQVMMPWIQDLKIIKKNHINKYKKITVIAEVNRDGSAKKYANKGGIQIQQASLHHTHMHTHTHTQCHTCTNHTYQHSHVPKSWSCRGRVCDNLYLLSSVFHHCLSTIWHCHPYFLLHAITIIVFYTCMI